MRSLFIFFRAITIFAVFTISISTYGIPYQNFSENYFFGDSLSDQGNINNFSLPVPWTVSFARDIGKNSNIRGINYAATDGVSTPSIAPVNPTNYAISGYTTSNVPFQIMTIFLDNKLLSDDQYIKISNKLRLGITPTNNKNNIDAVNQELENLVFRSARRLDSNALYFYWAGGNDYIADVANRANNITNPKLVVSRSINSINLLHSAGAENIVLFNLPDFSKSSTALAALAGAGLSASEVQALSKKHNNELLKEVLEANYPILLIDAEELFNNIYDNYTLFGFTSQNDLTHSDNFHPSYNVHIILGQALSQNYLSPLKTVNSMYTTTSNIIRNINQGILQQSVNNFESNLKIEAFVFGQIGYQKASRIYNNTNKSTPSNISLGVKYTINSNLLFGIGFSQHQQSVRKIEENSSFSNIGQTFSSFVSFQNKSVFLTTILQIGRENFRNIERNFKLNQTSILMQGKTTGTYVSTTIQTGMNFAIQKFKISPYIEIQNYEMKISPYTESESSGKITALNLDIHRQKNRVAQCGIGSKISYQLQYGITNYLLNINLAKFFTINRDITSIDYNLSTLPGTRASFDISSNEEFFKFETSISYIPIRKKYMKFSIGYVIIKNNQNTFNSYISLSSNLSIG